MARLALIALFAAACGGSEPEKAPAPPAPAPEAPAPVATPAPEAAVAAEGTDGKATFEMYCVACHQADGKGMNGTMAANLVEDKTRLAKPDEELYKIVREGKNGDVGAMPPWGGTLSDDQIKAVVGYLKATFGG